jgi:uncharacterized Zn finger protein
MALIGGRKVEMASEVLAENEEAASEQATAEPLPESPDAFWSRKPAPDNLLGEAVDSKVAALLDRVGQFPFWRGQDKFLETLRATYQGASQRVKQTITEF